MRSTAATAVTSSSIKAPKCRGNAASQASDIASYLVLLGGLLTIGSCIYMMVVTYSSLPYWDGWIEIQYPAGGGLHTASWLWAQVNEHRMPIPKLFLLADLHWFHARQVFLLSSIFAIQLLLVAVLGWTMREFGGWRGTVWRTGIGLACFCVFCLSQWENLTWGMQVCFVMPGALAGVSLAALLLYWLHSREGASSAPSDWKYIAVSIAAALGATWSYVNGNLLWPLLVAAALLLGLRLRAVLTYAVVGTLSTVLYLNNYLRPHNPASFLKTPFATLKFVAVYFGSSWISGDFLYRFRVAEIMGLIGLAVSCFLLWRLRSFVAGRRSFTVFLVLMLAFLVGTGIVTSAGRVSFGIIWALNSRYQAVALVFWCCLGLLFLDWAARRPERRIALLLTQLLFLGVMIYGAAHAGTPLIGRGCAASSCKPRPHRLSPACRITTSSGGCSRSSITSPPWCAICASSICRCFTTRIRG